MIFVLLVLIFLIFWLSYFLTGKDIFSPPCVACESFFISIFFALYNWDSWELWNYSIDAVFTIFVGMAMFALGSYFSYCIVKPSRKSYLEANRKTVTVIRIGKIKLVCCFLFEIIVSVSYYRFIRNLVAAYGYTGSITSILSGYNTLLTNNVLSVDGNGSFLLRQGVKMVFVLGLILLAVLINNFVIEGIRKREIILVITILPSLILSVLGSTRINIFKFVAFFFIIFNVVYHRYYGWDKQLKMKYIVRAILALACVLFVFSALRKILGRGTRFDPLYYLSVYAGGSIKLFDMFVTNGGAETNTYLGQETFSGVMSILARLGVIGNPFKRLEFRSYNEYYVGNVYTAFRRYYNDFGMAGILILSFAAGSFFSWLYIRSKSGAKDSLINFKLVFCGFISWGIYLVSIEEYMFSTCVSVLYVTYTIYLGMLYWILLRFHWTSSRQIRIGKGHG